MLHLVVLMEILWQNRFSTDDVIHNKPPRLVRKSLRGIFNNPQQETDAAVFGRMNPTDYCSFLLIYQQNERLEQNKYTFTCQSGW